MKRIALLAAALLMLTGIVLADSHGAWTANVDEKNPDRIYVSFTKGRTSHMGTTMNVAAFPALSAAQLRSATSVPVHFELRREAGVATFAGTFKNGDGAGQYTFVPAANYLTTIRALGVDTKGDDEEEQLFAYALHDVSTAFIRSMAAEGYRVSLDDYLSMRIFNVNPELVRELRALGYKNISADDLVATRIHGVTPDYIRKMRAAGWNLSLDELVASRIHGATPEFAEEMRKLGYANLSHDDLIAFRIHGVTAAFIRELAEAGYKNIPAEKLIDMRIHGIDAKFVKKMRDQR
jgi:hypothetical protein